ncbi:MAG: tetratricopeptide repeat protein [Planctomycetota bacterium]|nr:tetratricopeptide repeat protein [Planctomycetota bacterium]
MRSRVGWMLPALFACLLVAPLSGCASDTPNPFGPSEEEQDDAARVEYFETAAVTYYDGGRYDLAEVQFRKVLALDPNNKKAKRGLAKALYMLAAEGRFSRDQRATKLRESQRLLEEVVPLEWPNPDGPGNRRYEVQTDLAHVYADLGDLYDRDVRDLRHAIRTNPNADEAGLMAKAREQVQKRNGLYGQAIPLYEAVLKASPNNQYALAGLAKCHLQMGNDETGIYFANQYLQLSQRSQLGWKRELNKYAEGVGGMSKVTTQVRQEYLQRIHGARDKEKRMHLMLASVHMRRMEFGQAVQRYTSVVKIDSTVPAAYLERAQAYAALGDHSKAIADLEEYLKITDPAIHRQQRMNAVELLDRYQTALARKGATRPRPRPIRRAPAPAPAQPPANPFGSPDG